MSKVIVSGKLYVDKDQRDQCVRDHQAMVARARKHPGCLDLAFSADLLELDRINTYELFESEEHLSHWRRVANPPKYEFDRKRSNVQKHQIKSSGPPF